MNYLRFDSSDGGDGVTTFEAMAATSADQHAAVMAEVQQVLDWAWCHFPRSHGPTELGLDWDDDLQVRLEAGGWHAVTLTLTGSPAFAEAFFAEFSDPAD